MKLPEDMGKKLSGEEKSALRKKFQKKIAPAPFPFVSGRYNKGKQAGAELGQAQLKLILDFNQIQYAFGFSLLFI